MKQKQLFSVLGLSVFAMFLTNMHLTVAKAEKLVVIEPARLQEAGSDRHAGYYYPDPQTQEEYISEAPVMAGVSKRSRVGFVVGMTEKQLKQGFAPGYSMLAKGAEAEKLIIIASGNERYQTLFQLRALLAVLTAQARTSPMFSNSGSPEELNFLDLCRMAGFTQLTISNGKDLAHQIKIN